MNYTTYPAQTVEDIVRLRRRIDRSGIPSKLTDRNLIIGTWNVRAFGDLYPDWDENDDSPKRNLRGLACIAEIVSRFDVIAVQEVKRGTTAIRTLLRDFLGSSWGLVMSDVTAGDKGNSERLAFIYDRRRVEPSGLAGEIVLPPTPAGDPVEQFDRTPYIVGFRSAGESFALLTAHIRYGEQPTDRIGELRSVAAYIAEEIRDRATAASEASNLIVLGDFNIDERGDDPLFQAFVSSGLFVPEKLLNLKTTYNSEPKFYDQIAWFMDRLDMLTNNEAGVIDFAEAVFPELTPLQMTWRVSDHFPLWAEFFIDRSSHEMAATLGVDPSAPDPFAGVPD